MCSIRALCGFWLLLSSQLNEKMKAIVVFVWDVYEITRQENKKLIYFRKQTLPAISEKLCCSALRQENGCLDLFSCMIPLA